MTRGLIDEELGKREHEREIKKSTLLLGKGFPSSQGKSVNSSDELEGWDKHSKRWFNFKKSSKVPQCLSSTGGGRNLQSFRDLGEKLLYKYKH